MVFITELVLLSILSGLICFVWGCISFFTGIFTWVGFSGCTSFFIMNEKDPLKRAMKSFISNVNGSFYAFSSIYLSSIFDIDFVTVFLTTGFITVFIIYQSKTELFSCVPACFIGCFVTFGLNGDIKMAITGFFCGAVLGYALEMAGIFSKNFVNKKKQNIDKAA